MCCHDHHHDQRHCHDHHKTASHCCCGEGEGPHRRFFSKEEEIVRLEGYLKNLQAEIKAAEAKLQALKEE
jgi:hypothetical protein